MPVCTSLSRRLSALCLCVALGVACAGQPSAPASAPAPAALDAAWLLDQVKALTAPEMGGRGAGTAGADRAARHVAEAFRQAGLQPGGEDGHFQWFEVVTGVRLGEPNRLRVRRGDDLREYAAGDAFMPFRFSESGRAEAEVVFAGYGITAPDLGYDDYARLDARGKVVLVLTHEPRERDAASPFRAPEAFHYSELRHKVINAREHGARAIIIVTDPQHRIVTDPQHRHEPDRLTPLRGSGAAEWGILAAHASRSLAASLMEGSGLSLEAVQQEMDRALEPRSRPLPGVRVELEVRLVRERGRTANVVGLVPGRDPRLRAEAIVIGAHYDHLGIGMESSLAPDRLGEVHPGADDNASGTAALLGLARAFAETGGAARTLVFAAFGAEELGLLGSTHYARSPAVPMERTVAMLNLDSVGRLRDNRLHVMGVDSAREFRPLLAPIGRDLGLELRLSGDAVGPSDHTAFFARERPVLFFFTGPHGDYHRPSDTWDKLNAEGLGRVARAVQRIAEQLANREAGLAFVKAEGRPARASRDRVGGGYGAYFGSVPDFSESPAPGVRLGGVRPGSPADKAGLKAGDVIVRFAGVGVKSLDDLVFALRSRRAGDAVEVIYVRDGLERTAQATLEERR
jgi:hypothetical protein